jgi:hypothetical protein
MNTKTVIQEIREKISQHINKGQSQYSHSWSNTDSSHCAKCGDKDWCADTLCSVSDSECEINKGLKS